MFSLTKKENFAPLRSLIKSNIILIVGVLVTFLLLASCASFPEEVPVVQKWDTYSLDIEGPEVSETDEYNPFLNYSLVVTFSNGTNTYSIPGYFAADGDAAESSASKGNVWRVKFTPDQTGEWTYNVSFKKGEGIVLAEDKSSGESLDQDGQTGKFKVVDGTYGSNDFRTHGRLVTLAGEPYQQFAESKKYFVKGGADSPENLLAYKDFDGTFSMDSTKKYIKTYSAHVPDWQEGDPVWKDGKGKGLIGALNYMASKGINAIYFLSMNIEGDGEDVWMYESPDDFTRFDCSKLDQWNIVFSHAQQKGIILVPLLGEKSLDALSMQIDRPARVNEEIIKWKIWSGEAGHQWVMYMDEIGPYWQGVMPDSHDAAHDTIRREVLWGSLMAGAAGVEWYFGYKYPHADLNCEDWRTREKMWEQTKYAIDFFQNNIPFWEMKSDNDCLKNAKGYCLAKEGQVYAYTYHLVEKTPF